jgi:hypothetical protein
MGRMITTTIRSSDRAGSIANVNCVSDFVRWSMSDPVYSVKNGAEAPDRW